MRLRQSGMTMVEMLVAVTIGLIGILIITQAYITSENFNRSTMGEGGAQTNALFALYSIERDVRMAGYGIANSAALGCNQIYWYHEPNYSSNIGGGTLPNITLAPVLIVRDTTPPANVEPVQLTVMYGTDAERMMPASISSFNASSSEVTLNGTAGFRENDLVLIVGPTGCTLGKVTQVQPGPQKIQLNPGISAPHNPPAWGSFPTTYTGGDSVLNLGNPVVRTYSSASGKLHVNDGLLQAGAGTTFALVDGIVDMRAQYGHDTNADGTVDTWNSDTPTTSAGWIGVLAIRVGVLARIGNYEKPATGSNCDATAAAPTWSGSGMAADAFNKLDFATLTSQDRCYRYRVLETTIPLRNMIWRAT